MLILPTINTRCASPICGFQVEPGILNNPVQGLGAGILICDRWRPGKAGSLRTMYTEVQVSREAGSRERPWMYLQRVTD
jgi:hypothetical protein